MSKEFLKSGSIDKKVFYGSKSLINVGHLNIDKIVIFEDYFCRVSLLPEMSGYLNKFYLLS